MHYTIKQLADLSGISTRALRYYDEIGLFKPAYIAENQYRYYTKSQLVDLKQVLFFKALGLRLDEIKSVLNGDDYQQIDVLVANRNKLTEQIKIYEDLLANCQATIQYCRGKIMMRDKELFSGFDAQKQQAYEDYLVSRGVSQETIDASWKKVTRKTKQDRDALHQQCEAISKQIASCIQNKMPIASEAVQSVVEQHYQWVCEYWTPNRETYKGLAAMYVEHEEFASYYEGFHSDMPKYLQQAMCYYADKRL